MVLVTTPRKPKFLSGLICVAPSCHATPASRSATLLRHVLRTSKISDHVPIPQTKEGSAQHRKEKRALTPMSQPPFLMFTDCPMPANRNRPHRLPSATSSRCISREPRPYNLGKSPRIFFFSTSQWVGTFSPLQPLSSPHLARNKLLLVSELILGCFTAQVSRACHRIYPLELQ